MEFATLVRKFAIAELAWGGFAFDGAVYDEFSKAYMQARNAAHSWVKDNVRQDDRKDYAIIGSQFGMSVYKVN